MIKEWVDSAAVIAGNETNSLYAECLSLHLSIFQIRILWFFSLNFSCAEGSTDSNPSTVVDEEGLPFPPLDEGALFASQTPIELSQV